MNGWNNFKLLVERNILSRSDHEVLGLSYWRDRLFTNIIVYLLPVSLVALVPGVVMSIVGGIPLLAVYDTLAAISFAIIAFNRKFSLPFRKALLIFCLYMLSIMLLVYLGSFGPGLLYLLALSIFITLIFPMAIAKWSIVVNTVICVIFAGVIHFQWLHTPLTQVYTLGSWIAVSSNLIFLSAVIVASLNLLFNGLETTILKEAQLQKQLRDESKNLQKLLASLETKNHELEQFAYIASHDMQEPLQTITNVVDVFSTKYKEILDTQALTYLSFLAQSATRMKALILGLLEYSRIGKERRLELVNCNTILMELQADMEASLLASNAILVIDHLPSLPAYPLELKQLFQNLISNALKFRKEGIKPQVNITAQEQENQWTFSVSDNGIGIEEKFREKIFIIFQRLHSKAKYEGTGIGLAQCRKIAELHGGKIWVEAQKDTGSIFTFTIPKN
ncbi:MAG: ATP-binding protein [Bacteroidota bacterium]